MLPGLSGERTARSKHLSGNSLRSNAPSLGCPVCNVRRSISFTTSVQLSLRNRGFIAGRRQGVWGSPKLKERASTK